MKKILVIEDDKLLGRIFCKYLDKAGYQVFWAENAKKAYEAIQAQSLDMIFLDIMLPEIDGYQVLREIRASSKFSQIPLVVLSNLSSSSDMEKAMNLGATDYIIKSNVDLNELVEKINSDYLPS